MNRKEFMQQLESLLNDLPVEEKKEALSYYEDYFDDAGEQNEQKVIAELVNPSRVAATIKQDLGEQGIYTERGYEQEKFRDYQTMTAATQTSGQQQQQQKQQDNGTQTDSNKMNSSAKLLLIVILVLSLPVWGGLALGILGTAFGLMIALIAVTVAFSIAAVALVGAGIGMFFALQFAKGFLLVGVGCILAAFALPCLVLVFWLCGKWIPAFFRWVASVGRNIFGNGGVTA